MAELSDDEAIKLELKDQIRRLQAQINGLSEILELKDENSVYWIERTGKQNQIIHLRSAPLDIAHVLKEQLFSRDVSVIMTSATLTRKEMPILFKLLSVQMNSILEWLSLHLIIILIYKLEF